LHYFLYFLHFSSHSTKNINKIALFPLFASFFIAFNKKHYVIMFNGMGIVELTTGGNTSSHLSYKDIAGGYAALQIYRRRPGVNILCQAMREHLYPTNLPPEAN
jgi:hypothetical protein